MSPILRNVSQNLEHRFLLLACNKDKKYDLQVIQNDVSVELLHKNAKLVSLEQRRCKQLLSLLYKMSKDQVNIVVPARNTRRQDRIVFRIDNKIGTKYACSPYYKGTKIWDTLPKEIQDADSIHVFKKILTKGIIHR